MSEREQQREFGILVHPTSLPGPEGIGTIGPSAYAFIDSLAQAGAGLWQVLPLVPTGYGDSPYAGLSAFAGNPLLISLDLLVEDGVLSPSEARPPHPFPDGWVDFGSVTPWKMQVLRTAFKRSLSDSEIQWKIRDFVKSRASWLDDYALFAALKDEHGGRSWSEWEPGLRHCDPPAVGAVRERLECEIEFQRWAQYTFFAQWYRLRSYAHERGVRIVGDIPIFVAYDSADVWSRQNLFKLDEGVTPTVVAGVPPDYFSSTGQLWGNPHYRWDVMAAAGYSWWIDRFHTLSELVDVVRLDHFRGFAAAWEVPFGNPTAEHGRWVEGPGEGLLETVRKRLPNLEIIAEDLGVITPDVEALRDRFGFPGMKILQFAFGSDATNGDLPHNYSSNTVVYTGTHDNDTTLGWWASITEDERCRVRAYTASAGYDIAWDLLRLALASVSRYALAPLQDILRLGTAARMNLPGRPDGNWQWRFREGDLSGAHLEGLAELATIYGRRRPSPVEDRQGE